MSDRLEVEVDGRTVVVARPDKVMFPGAGHTKADVVDFYRRVSGHLLPHLRDRPLTLRRFPDGAGEAGFFQKEASDHFPDWIERVAVDAPHSRGGVVHHVLCQDAATLVYLAGQAALELHPWLSRADAPDRPDRMVVDLDPADGTPLAEVRRAARAVRDVLRPLGLAAYLQASGGRGYHVVAPLDATSDTDVVLALARRVAQLLTDREPERYTTAQRTSERGDRILLDVGRNGRGQTTVAPYSLRARDGAPAATPIDWDELGRVRPDRYTLTSLPRRVARKPDPWSTMDRDAASAAAALERATT